jgi:hypothetical protein
VRSCAHWLNWRCGIGLTAAREKVRVGHALAGLPQTQAAFASGQLSYSKARAITRVGTQENESFLLSYAQYGSASQLEKTCRLYRNQYSDRNDDAEQERRVSCRHHDQRQLTTHWDAHGCLIVRANLTPEQGALVLKAIEAAVDTLSQTTETEAVKDDSAESPPLDIDEIKRQRGNRRADALVLMAESLLQHKTSDSCSADRYQVIVHVDAETLMQQRYPKPSFKPDCTIEKQIALPIETARRLSCCSKLVVALRDGSDVLSVGRSTRAVPPAIQRALQIRDGVCQFPGCACQHHLDAHHIEHWADGGETSLDNLIQLCHAHHKLMHEGGFSVARVAGKLVFKKPDGSDLSPSPRLKASDRLLPLQAADIWQWCGDSMDYSTAMSGLARADNRELSP